jgi:hypothetical protein
MLLLALWEPLNWLFWLPAIGTPAQVLFGYCTLARCLSLMPWNRREPLSTELVRRTFLSAGQGQRDAGLSRSALIHATLKLRRRLNKSFDKLRTNGKLLIPFVVSLSNVLLSEVEGHERNQLVQHFLRRDIMNTTLNDIVVHLDENVDEATLHMLEQDIRLDQAVISVGHRPNQNHLMMVVYDSAVARAASILHTFRERGLHAQLIGWSGIHPPAQRAG